jgi:hypothetical protein
MRPLRSNYSNQLADGFGACNPADYSTHILFARNIDVVFASVAKLNVNVFILLY